MCGWLGMWALPEVALNQHRSFFQIVVLHVGTNNVSNTAEEVAEGISEIVNAIRQKLPDAYIVLPVGAVLEISPPKSRSKSHHHSPIISLQTLLPRGQQPNPLREKNNQVNKLVSEQLTGMKKVQTVQIDKGLVQKDGTISHHDMFDYLNLTNTGCKKVFEPIFDLLSQILNENEPEKDLTPSE